MRLDINISAGLPSPGDDGFQGAQLGSQMGHLLARMEFDYPTQMLAVVKVDNDDGTYDCHRPGTSIYMSRVETISPVLAARISVGMTVLIRFFRRDRSKPYIVRVAGGIAPAADQAYWYWCRGSAANAMRAGTENAQISLSTSSTVWAGPLSDGGTASRTIVAMVVYRIGTDEHIATLAVTSTTQYTLYCHKVSDASQVWSTSFAFTTAVSSQDLTGMWLQYNADLDVLAVAGMKIVSSFVSADKVWMFSGTDGTLQGTYVDDAAGHMVARGFLTQGERIVRVYHTHNTLITYPQTALEVGEQIANPDIAANRRFQHKVTGFALSVNAGAATLAEEWTWDPRTVLEATPSVAVVKSQTSAMAGALVPVLMPGASVPYISSREAMVFAISAHMPLRCNESRNWGHAQKLGQTPAVHRPDDAGTAYRLDCRSFNGWIIALKTDGTVDWEYEIGEILATDADHYIVDTANFGQATIPADVDPSPPPGAYVRYTYIGLPNDQHYDVAAESAAAYGIFAYVYAGSIPQVYPTRAAAPSGVAFSKLYPQYKYWQMGAGYHWEPTAEIRSGDNRSEDGTGTAAVPTNHNPQLALDADDNIYCAYLQPYGIVSPIHPFLHKTHYSTFSYQQRTGYKFRREMDVPTVGSWTDRYEYFDMPWRHTAWRSFLMSLSPAGQLRWRVELTFWGDDYQFSSATLDDEVPYAGSVLRVIPTSAGLFVLRTIRLPVMAPKTIPALAQIFSTSGDILDYAGHRGCRFCKTVLELYSLATGARQWQETLYDPSSDASATMPSTNPVGFQPSSRYHLDGAWMYSSESSGLPWVVGRISHAAVSKMFTADSAGVVTLRDATSTDPLQAASDSAISSDSMFYRWQDTANTQGNGANRWYLRRWSGA